MSKRLDQRAATWIWRAAAGLVLVSALVSNHSIAAPTKNGNGVPETLLLEITVNEQPLPGIILAERLADGHIALPADVWRESRLKTTGEAVPLSDGSRGYVLNAVPGLDYKLDRARLTLAITAPAGAFETTALAVGGRGPSAPTTPPPGAYLNYDVSTTYANPGSNTYGAFVEGIGFNGWGAFITSAAIRGDDHMRADLVRVDTTWRKDFPDKMETMIVGDAVGTGGAWSRPVRFGGVRYARDFSLAPGFITYPMPSISGSAALPSTVDLLINNRRNATTNVQTGPFELTNVPIITGAGEMQLVVRDMLGRETVISQSYYVAPQLLAAGLSDFSYEAGALRENYGIRSADYGPLFAAGTFRQGLTDTVTAEARAELQRDRAAAGGAVATTIGKLGVVGLATSYAMADGEHGGHYVASFQRTSQYGGASLAWDHSDRGYRPFGSNISDVRPRDEIIAGAGMTFGPGLTAAVSYTRQTTWTGDRFTIAGANFGIPLPGNMSLNGYVSKQLETGNGWSGGINLIIPFDERRTISLSSTRDSSRHAIDTVQATQSTPAGPGWGWHVEASDNPLQRLQAGLAYNSNYAQVIAEANEGSDANALRLSASGSLGWLQGLPFASRRIDQGAFAVVHIGDIEGVPVSLSNQVVATTNGHGLALVTGLLPYQPNQLTLNPDQLPLEVEIGSVHATVVPYARSGVFVDFPTRRSHDVLVVLQQPDGTPIPPGARVTLTPGGQEFIVARRGEVYLLDVNDDSRIDVRWKTGSCTLTLPTAGSHTTGEAARIGPLTCGEPK